jgi:capsular exopolysaccharide synthesis family protein
VIVLKELSPYFISRDEPAPAGFPPWHSSNGSVEGVNFKEYWGVVQKYRAMISSLTLAAAVIIFAWYFGHTPQYQATSTILIQPQMPQVISDLKDLMEEQNAGSDYDYYKTQFDLLKSQSLAARVIHDNDLGSNALFKSNGESSLLHSLTALAKSLFKPEESFPRSEKVSNIYGAAPQLVTAYIKRLSIEPKRGTQLVIIGFTTPNPRLSAAIANAHVRTYIRQGLDLHAQAGKNVEEFLQQKVGELKDKVEQSEAALNQYRRDRGIVALENGDEKSGTKTSPLMQRIEQLNTELTQASERRITLETEHQLIAKRNYESLPEVISNQVIQNIKEQVSQLSTQYASMQNRYNPGYHPLDDLHAKLSEEQRRLDQEIYAVAQSVDTNYRSTLANETKIQNEITQVKSEAMALNDASLQEAVLERQVDANRELYQSVLKRMNEINVAADVSSSNVSVVDAAVPPRTPTGPGLLELLLFGCAGALFVGIALAFFVESMDDTFKTSQEVPRYLGLPSFGIVPDFHKVSRNHYSPRSYLPSFERRSDSPEITDGSDGGKKELIVGQGDFSVASEMYRAMRTAIMFSRAGGAPKVILITSSTSGEGKTITASNVAAAFAQTGNRTLLIDADLRRSRCHEMFGIEPGQGLTEILVNLREFAELIVPTKVPGLSFLPAGALPPNPSELLASPEMRALIEKLSEGFDYLVFDSAPIMPVSDSVGLSTMVDGVVVVAGGETSRKLVIETCGRLTHVGAKILGVVLNRVDITGDSYYRYNHYSYYNSYKPKAAPTDQVLKEPDSA